MPERIFIGVAWPYANGSLHLGHVAGSYLPADIFARYHRIVGDEVLMVSGSDQHGTPITLLAESRKVSPRVIVDQYHKEFLETWEKLGITFDLFTNTGTLNHEAVVHEFFKKFVADGTIYKASMPQPYCETCHRFLPDRYVEGKCPFCGFQGARGDQCDNCGKPLDPAQLIGIKCRISGDTPEIKDSEHFFLKLSAFEEKLLSWIQSKDHLRPDVHNFTVNYLKGGLHDRAITRDIEWGIKIPLAGYDSKRMYVWFEAVCGYLSASKEWAALQKTPDKWKDFWQDLSAKSYYFMGKDNIPFHTIVWPAILMGVGGLNLPYDVPANQFLTLEGQKLSTSRNWAVWMPEYLSNFAPDPLRYYLSLNMPESSDIDFSWLDFMRANNTELVATYGNLVHRTLTFMHRNFDGSVPDPGELDDEAKQVLQKCEAMLAEVAEAIRGCHFKSGLKSAMALAKEANRYIDGKAPWKTIKTDRQETARTLWTSMALISGLKTAFYPFLPFSSAKLHAMLGNEDAIEKAGWVWQKPKPGTKFNFPEPLFTKMEEEVIQKEISKLGKHP
ncbi:MAG: methionine--tRNA ligase [Dehalococcoidia bacterium]|nr:methionine--tRNA ligase [Dehalococcoidia bacterium]